MSRSTKAPLSHRGLTPQEEWDDYQKQKAAFLKDFDKHTPFDWSTEEMQKEPEDRKPPKKGTP